MKDDREAGVWPDQSDPKDTPLAFHAQLTVPVGTAPLISISELPLLFHAPPVGLQKGSQSYDHSQLKNIQSGHFVSKW